MSVYVHNALSTTGVAVASLTLSAYDSLSNDNDILVVAVSNEDEATAPTIDSVTFKGDALIKSANTIVVGPSFDNRCEIWYFIAPVGIGDVVATFAAVPNGCAMIACTLSGAVQQAPEATNTSTDIVGPPHSTAITTITNGAFVLDALVSNNALTLSTSTTETRQEERAQVSGGSQTLAISSIKKHRAGSQTMGWSSAGWDRAAHVLTAWEGIHEGTEIFESGFSDPWTANAIGEQSNNFRIPSNPPGDYVGDSQTLNVTVTEAQDLGSGNHTEIHPNAVTGSS